MRLKSLRLRGAIGLKKVGDEIEIDFNKFSPGLICLIGENGAGKTTLVENLHPFPRLISRSGALYNHFYSADSYRDLTVEIDGAEWRFYLVIDAERQKTESYVYKNGLAMNDGKRPSYERIVEELFGDPELYFKSVFTAQGETGLLGIPASKRKELFSNLLDLNQYQPIHEWAKTELTGARYYLDVINKKIGEYREKLKNRETIINDLDDINNQIEFYNNQIADLKQDLHNHEAMRDEVNGRVVQQKQLLQRRSEHEVNIQSLEIDSERQISELRDHNASLDQKRIQLQSKAKLYETRLKIRVTDEMIEKENEYRRLTSEMTDLKNQLSELGIKFTTEIDNLKDRITVRKKRYARAEADLKNKQALTQALTEVPCFDHKEFVSVCPYLEMARKAELALPDIKDGLNMICGSLKGLEDELGVHQEVYRSERDEIKNKIDHNFDALELLGYKAPTHGVSWHDLKAQYDQADVLLTETQSSINDLTEQVNNNLQKMSDVQRDTMSKVNKSKVEIQNLNSLIDTNLLKNVTDLDAQIDAIKTDIDNAQTKLQTWERSKGSTENELKQLNELKQQLKQDQKDQIELLEKVRDYDLLKTAFGQKEGIPALELENALPSIAEIANDILSGFDKSLRIRFDLTKPTADGKKQLETLEIMIINSDDNELRLENLSGGEKVWIITSIQKAIAVYLRDYSGHITETVIADECDGQLDPQRAMAYYEATKQAHELTGAYHTIFITHRHEIAMACDQRIELVCDGCGVKEVY